MGEYVLYTNEVTLNRVVTKGFDPTFLVQDKSRVPKCTQMRTVAPKSDKNVPRMRPNIVLSGAKKGVKQILLQFYQVYCYRCP